jgi:hypothetical protein
MRLTELRHIIDSLSPNSMAFNRQWHKWIAHPGDATLSSLAFAAQALDNRPVQRDDVLRITKNAPTTYAIGTDRDGDTCFYLYVADKELSVGGEWVPFLKTMLDQETFIAESAVTWAGGDNPNQISGRRR